MAAGATPHTWTCPSCGRRVPLRAEVCHCGMTRARADEIHSERPAIATAPRHARATSDGRAAVDAMTTDVKLLLAVTTLVLVSGIGWLALGPRAEPYPALLGHVDKGPPTSNQLKARQHPPFKLPWWR